MEGDFGRFVGNVLRVKSKRGRPPVLSAQAFYPMREERELQALLRGELLRSWTASVAEQLERFSDEDASEPFGDGFMDKVWKIADAIIVNAQQSLVKFSEMTIGVPYYPPAVSESVKKDWVDTFQKLCISADTQGKADIATAIYTAKSEGKNKYQVEHEVEQFLPAKTRHRAELIARTETGKLNNAATMATYESAGIRYYRWLATTDERTRPTHAAMNDLICAVGDPDHYYEETPEGLEKKGRTAGMYHGDPGTDFQCRCTSVPWDPRIHGKYDVKEVPEPPEKAPSKLEQARAETAKAEERAEEAEKRATKAEEKAKEAELEMNRLSARNSELEKEIRKLRAESLERSFDIQIAKEDPNVRKKWISIIKEKSTNILDGDLKDKLTVASLKALGEEIPKTLKKFGLEKFKEIKESSVDMIAGYLNGKLFINPSQFNDAFGNPKKFFNLHIIENAKRYGLRDYAIDKPEQVRKHIIDHEIGHYVFDIRGKIFYGKLVELRDAERNPISRYAMNLQDVSDYFAEMFSVFARGGSLSTEKLYFIEEALKYDTGI